MCSHYQALKEREKFLKVFGVEPPLEDGKLDVWPGYLGAFIRKHPNAEVGDAAVPHAEALNGLFGLVPHWANDTKITKSTYNCRRRRSHANKHPLLSPPIKFILVKNPTASPLPAHSDTSN